MKTIQFIIAIILFAFVSCTKDKPPVETTPSAPKEYIIIGDVEGMRVDNIEKEVNGDFNQIDQLELDVNGDGISDLEFQVGFGSSPGMGIYTISNLNKMHDRIFILHELLIDTTYLNEVVNYQYGGDGKVKRNTIRSFNCKQPHPDYLFYDAEEKAIASKFVDMDSIWFDGEFLNEGLSFVYEHWWTSVDNQNDTIFITESSWKYDCQAFPTQTPVYIAIKLEKDGVYHYGWIRLHFNDYINVQVQQMAIQRNF